ncbi:MAG: electron transport complex subunit RsxE [Candidatus Rokubacteria bacterium]|nr:electron transport complex subunit RsxE [Candidatus Rokubacteria bacterium]
MKHTVEERPHCGVHGAAPTGGRRPVAATEDLIRGVWRDNPVLIQMLGLCPTLAVTNSVANSIVMAVATFFVLVGSSFLVASIKRWIPNEVRISSYILIIATFVTVADMSLEALVPTIHKALGAFVPLIVVNCIILGRAEAFASKNPVGRSLLDAAGNGAGFMIALLLMGTVRELLGSGSFLGYPVLGPRWEPWVIMILPPGGFLTLAFLLLALNWTRQRRLARAARVETAAPAEVAGRMA